jgi:mono/diheme cytochrome c family protein
MRGSPERAGAFVIAMLFALGACASAGCAKKPKADPAEGRTLFVNACARCHGVAGDGGLPLFDGGPSPRNFCDHSFHASHTDEQIKLTIVNGKGVGMPPFGTTFTDAQLDALVAHVRAFDPEKSGK